MPIPLSRLMCAVLCVAVLAACGKKPAPPAAARAVPKPAQIVERSADTPAAPDTGEPTPPPAAAPVAVSPVTPARPPTPATRSHPAKPSQAARQASHPAPAPAPHPDNGVQSECSRTAAAALGQGAEVLRCGPFSRPGVVEVLAIQRKHRSHAKEEDIFASRIVILRKQPFGWILALDVAQKVKNEAGYIAIDYADGDAALWGYRVKLHETLPDDSHKHFTLEVGAMHDEKDAFDPGTEIAFDPQAGRYRAYNDDSGAGAFQSENMSPLPVYPVRKTKTPAHAPAPAATPAPPKTPTPAPAPKAT